LTEKFSILIFQSGSVERFSRLLHHIRVVGSQVCRHL
jgi:hypothetical protein